MMRPDILCLGALHWDVIGRCPGRLERGDDRPGRVLRRPGGVAFNVARHLARLGMRPALLSAVGRDPEGAALRAACAAAGVDADPVEVAGHATGLCVALEDGAGLVAAVADPGPLETVGAAILAPLADGRLGQPDAPWTGPAVVDSNLSPAVLAALAAGPWLAAADLRAVAASNVKAARLAPLAALPRATLYLNLVEARLLGGGDFADAPAAAAALSRRGARVVVTDGPGPVALGIGGAVTACVPPPVRARRVTGAGDCLAAHHLAAERRGLGPAAALAAAAAAAARHVADAGSPACEERS